jgi:hypothetical protein
LTGRPLVLSCSPRTNGNCDTAAALFLEGLGPPPTGAGDRAADSLTLREYAILPCIGCGRCARFPGAPCPLEAQDGSGPLLRTLRAAPAFCFVAPVYFYHLPARFKAFIDRGQSQWAVRALPENAAGPPQRTAWVILIGAREKGKNLFAGSLLTLRYWLKPFGIALAPPLCLCGLDGPRDLAGDGESRGRIREYAATARQAFFGDPA